jgi:hypothetical protein
VRNSVSRSCRDTLSYNNKKKHQFLYRPFVEDLPALALLAGKPQHKRKAQTRAGSMITPEEMAAQSSLAMSSVDRPGTGW